MEDWLRAYYRYTKHKKDSKETYEPDVDLRIDDQLKKTAESIIKHKKSVKRRLLFVIDEIKKRADHHDDSKLDYPELGWLVAMDKEGRVPYGSDAYFEKQKRWECFFKHHYDGNTHHPDHFGLEGTHGMTIIDLVEMMCDIISYSDELESTKVFDLVNEQAERFGLSEELADILKNTITTYFASIGGTKADFDPKDFIGRR